MNCSRMCKNMCCQQWVKGLTNEIYFQKIIHTIIFTQFFTKAQGYILVYDLLCYSQNKKDEHA
jgi:hypothetical protein